MKRFVFGIIAILCVFALVMTSCDNGTTTKKADKVSVTFDLNYDGAPAATVKQVDKGQSLGTNFPAAPTRAGYNFQGWYENRNGSGTQLLSTTVVNANRTVYAHWSDESIPELYELPEGAISLGDFTLSNGDTQKGWASDGVDNQETGLDCADVVGAKYLVLDLTAIPSEGMLFAWQGNGKSGWDWTQTDGILSDVGEPSEELGVSLIPKDDGIIALQIELSKAITDYEDFLNCTQIKFFIAYGYNSPDGIASLGLVRAYLIPDVILVDPTNPTDPGYTVPEYPANEEDAIVEEIGLSNGWSAIFQFVLPEGKEWSDYKGLTAEHKLVDVKTAVRARVWGNFVPSEVAAARFSTYNGKNFAVVGSWPGGSSGRWIWDNTYQGVTAADTMLASAVPTPANDTWFKVSYTIDGSKAHAQWNGHDNAANALEGREPQGYYKGPFYIGVGLSTNVADTPVVSQIKNVTLLGYKAADDLVGMPLYFKSEGGALYRAYNGQLDDDGNLQGGKPSWSIISGQDKITAAAITGLAPAPAETVTITFDPNYTNAPAATTKIIIKGAKLDSADLASPGARDGFVFLGWYSASTDGTKATANDTYDADTRLYAQWKEFVVPPKVTITGDDLDDLVAAAWGAKADNDGYIIMASADWNNTNNQGASNNDSLINIAFPSDLDEAFTNVLITYDFKAVVTPTLTTEQTAAGWVVDAGGITKKYNTGDNAGAAVGSSGTPGSYFSFIQSGGVLNCVLNSTVLSGNGVSIQINKGDDTNNKQKRDGFVYGIKITKIEFVYRVSEVLDVATAVTPAWGATKDADGYIIMASAAWNGAHSDPADDDSPLNGASADDSLINIALPTVLNPLYDKVIVTYSFKSIEEPTLGTGEDDYTIDAAGIAKKYNSGDNAGAFIGSDGTSSAGTYFSFNQAGGTLYFALNSNVLSGNGVSIQINKGDDTSNKQKRDGFVYGIKITKVEIFYEAQ